MFRSIGAIALAGLASAAAAQTAPAPDAAAINVTINAPLPHDQAALKSHVMFLASDAMAGREAGTRDFDIAAQYVASQFYAAGLKPAGDAGSYLQRVPLVGYKIADKGSMVLTRKGADPMPLAFGDDYYPSANPARAVTTIDAPVVFVGYGIVAPQFRRDDYAGANVRGKIVAFLSGTPGGYPPEERAHFSNPATKAREAQDRGAVGVIDLGTPGDQRAVLRAQASWDRTRVTWANADGTGSSFAPAAPYLAALTPAGAAKLMAGARRNWVAVAKLAATPDAKFTPEQLPGSVAVSIKSAFEPMTSSNVAGLVVGGDPKLKSEVVVLSAHLDHLGARTGGSGDMIFNGALDNAVGIASLIEEAKRFKAEGKPPRRSILFLAVTAEEKGLVGSDYFANHPTVARDSIVADVNLDMPIITYPFQDMVVFGANHSTLGPIVEKAVNAMGLTMAPDPMPEEGIFVRSDHYRFVQQGIPSVFLWPGPGGPGKAAEERFMRERYHKVSDDLTQPIDWEAGVRFVAVNYAIAREIADGDQRPLWNKGDYFGTLYKGPMAK